MNTRTIKEKDIHELSLWYHGQGWESTLSREVFPRRGYMVDDHAAVWFYVDDESKFGWLAFQVVNPRKNMAMAMKALHTLYERVDREAEALGIKYLMQTVSHSSLKKLASQHNYREGDKGLSSYWKNF